VSTLPSVLRVRSDGTLFCCDGRDVREYLAAWAKTVGATEDTPLNIMRRDGHERDHEDAQLLRNFAS
jgi:hypothetical protein